MFWLSTPAEVKLVLEALTAVEKRRERAADQRAGLIASEVFNTAPWGKKRKAKQPGDYFLYPEDKAKHDTPEGLAKALRAWAERSNKRRQEA